MKHLIGTLFLLLAFALSGYTQDTGQIVYGSGIFYTDGKPTINIDGYSAMVAYDTLNHKIYYYKGGGVWDLPLEISQGAGVPSGDPGTNPKAYLNTSTGAFYRWSGSDWEVSAGGGGGSGEWGFITGTLSAQTDLQNELTEIDDSLGVHRTELNDLADSINVHRTAIDGITDGVTEHGLLTGLNDDDHTQYHNDARADTWLSTKDSDDIPQGATNQYYPSSDQAKLAGIEPNATQDQTAGEIKTLYESNANTNAFTDSEQSKLSGIEPNSTGDQTNSEIETAYNNQVPIVSQAHAEAGTSTTVYRWTPERVAQAIAALAGGGGGTWGSIVGTLSNQTDLQAALDAKANTSHNHGASDITSGTFADGRIAQSNVTQHEASLTITESQISDLSHTTDTDDQDLSWVDGTNTIQITDGNNAIITGFSETGHTHTESDISDLDHYTDSDIDGSESAFDGWDKNSADDFDGDYNNLTNKPTIPVIDGTAYGATWSGNTDGATKGALYTKIEALVSGAADGNGIFDAANDGGAVSAGFDFAITDSLTIGQVKFGSTGNIWNVGTFNGHTIPGGTGILALTSDLHDAVTINAGSSTLLGLSGQELSLNQGNLQITESQITDLGSYISGVAWGDITGTLSSQTDLQSALDGKANSSHNHNATDINAGTFSDARIAESNVTQHQSALVITESQISDLSHTVDTDTQLTDEQVQDKVGAMVSGNTETLISATYQDSDGTIDFVVDDDLSNYDNSVSNFSVDGHTHSAGDVTSGTFNDARIAQSNVTQHQAALTITESQISDLSHTVDTKLTQEEVEDFTGALVMGGTHSLVMPNYSDAGGTLSFEVESDLSQYDNGTSNFSTGAHLTADNTAYGVSWDGNTTSVPSFDVLYDKFESLPGGHSPVTIAAGSSSILGLSGQELSITESALSITESQISDLGSYITGIAWGDITGTLSNQTDLQSALDGKANSSHTHSTSDVTSGTFADGRISESSVTQHEGALTITESQISDLSHTVDTDDQTASEVNITDTGGHFVGTTVEAALQELGADQHTHSNKAVLDATTASFLVADESKLDGIEAGAEVNVNADWNSVGGDSEILNKPTISGSNTGDEVDANTTTKGIVELATEAEVNTGTDGTRAVTPLSLATIQSNITTNNAKISYTDAAAVALNTAKLTANTANVTAAGALMDSEVDADIKTLDLPANTTISSFGKSLVDDADAATARTTLGVDAAGTDNSTDVTLDGALDYLTIAGQVITRNAIDLSTDITGTLDESNIDAAIARDSELPTNTSDLVNDSGFITSPNDADASATNELQTIDVSSFDGTNINLSLSSDGEATKQIDISSVDTDTQLSNEQVEDIVGAMVSGNTESDITVTYQDGDGTIDFAVDKTGNWTGTLDGNNGSDFLSRSNHTGTQTASTISDFDTEVSNNTTVSGNSDDIDDITPNTPNTQTSGTVNFSSEYYKYTIINMSGLSSITMTLSNPVAGGTYLFKFINADDGDTVTWATSVKDEQEANAANSVLASGRRLVTLVYDGTNYNIGGFINP